MPLESDPLRAEGEPAEPGLAALEPESPTAEEADESAVDEGGAELGNEVRPDPHVAGSLEDSPLVEEADVEEAGLEEEPPLWAAADEGALPEDEEAAEDEPPVGDRALLEEDELLLDEDPDEAPVAAEPHALEEEELSEDYGLGEDTPEALSYDDGADGMSRRGPRGPDADLDEPDALDFDA
jgi:hypothetical protein